MNWQQLPTQCLLGVSVASIELDLSADNLKMVAIGERQTREKQGLKWEEEMEIKDAGHVQHIRWYNDNFIQMQSMHTAVVQVKPESRPSYTGEKGE